MTVMKSMAVIYSTPLKWETRDAAKDHMRKHPVSQKTSVG